MKLFLFLVAGVLFLAFLLFAHYIEKNRAKRGTAQYSVRTEDVFKTISPMLGWFWVILLGLIIAAIFIK